MSNSPSGSVPHAILVCCALVLGLAGCQAFKRSDTWAKVTKIHGTRALDPNASETYASRLHDVLKADAVEHKVVTYQYRYTTRLREEAVSTRTAVLYKDKATPGSPWWLMDDQLGKPVWLPNGEVEHQMAFYLRQPAQVVAQSEFRGDGGDAAKSMVAGQAGPGMVVHEAQLAKAKRPSERQRELERTQPSADSATFVAAVEQAKPSWFERAAALFRLPHFGSEGPEPAAVPVNDLDQAFRASHGTDYDSSSAKDRRKMEQLKHALLQAPKLVQARAS